jgi:hypothetical protein
MLDKLKQSTTFLVFAASTTAYGLAYFYSSGYLAYFGITSQFAQITPGTILAGAITAVIMLAVMDILLGLHDSFQTNDPNRYAVAQVFVLLLLLVTISGLVLANLQESHKIILTLLVSVGLGTIVCCLIFLDYIFNRFRGVTHKDALRRHMTLSKERPLNGLGAKQESYIDFYLRLIPTILLPILIFGVACLASYLLGKSNANINDKSVTIIKSSSATKLVLVGEYGGDLLLKAYDSTHYLFIYEYRYRSSNDATFETKTLHCSIGYLNQKKHNTLPNNYLLHCPNKQ